MKNFYSLRGDRVQTGYGKCHASFGELVQGQLPGGEDFLITLPVNLWSQTSLVVSRSDGPLRIVCRYHKSADVVRRILDRLKIDQPLRIEIEFEQGIPVGKGLSSSTADMLATIRALQEVFGFLLRPDAVSKIFTEIEPHDGLMYKSCVLYNHREGKLLKDYNYVPHFWILGLDFGGVVDTVEFNRNLVFDDSLRDRYSVLVNEISEAFARRDSRMIADVSTRAAKLHCEHRADSLRLEVMANYRSLGAIGVVNTHSGTCLGLLFPSDVSIDELERVSEICQRDFRCTTLITRTIGLVE